MVDLKDQLRNPNYANSSAFARAYMTEAADRIAALEAQLAERVRVKPLVWRGTEGVWAKADALFGATYRITDYAGMAKPFKLETVGFVGPNGHYGTLDDAKAAAQADFERRILSALEATPAPMVTECATEGCARAATVRFERGGVGSDYCYDCYMRIQALTAAQEEGR